MISLDELLDHWIGSEPASVGSAKDALHILEEAKRLIDNDSVDSKPVWLRFLDITRHSRYLLSLPDFSTRLQWTEIVCRVLQKTNYGLLAMMEQRVAAQPHHTLFTDQIATTPVDWTYEQVYRHLQEIAAVFYRFENHDTRVAIYTENCLEGACTDLACLMFDIYITPLSPHFKQDILLEIFRMLNINIALADSEERIQVLLNIREKMQIPLEIISLLPLSARYTGIPYLTEICKSLSPAEIKELLEKRIKKSTSEVATTMFTSGSTGVPKGVSFSYYNIVSKRFSRAAALPRVDQEVFLCYLPLFHTFGRYLEMTGAIFWSGTYIFAGNTSAETLLSLFPKVNPTGFISIPLRWQELYDRCQEMVENIESKELRAETVRRIVGSNLHWGLSAAGYLDPAVFRFFNEYGVHLNSGFGMTEATGGITMTPPGAYRDGTVGIPLPGVRTRLNEYSELELSGHYIGRYLEDAGPGSHILYPDSSEKDYWMKTGDVFRISPDGYYEIVDRVKDIYKNNRGQTVAPQTIEKKFHQVPGIVRVFLVGDNRPYNVLLIVPDPSDPVFKTIDKENQMEYFHQIVMAANEDVAPYERVINFTLLDRDFTAEKGELTPKGSYNRKTIENNFSEVIQSLYLSKIVTISTPKFAILIPKWFFRDIAVLENDLHYNDGKLINVSNRKSLIINKIGKETFRIGDFIYSIKNNQVDLGIFTRQPKLWIGNGCLISFCPVKEGWDVQTDDIELKIRIPKFTGNLSGISGKITGIRNQQLSRINELLFLIYSNNYQDAYSALEEIGNFLLDPDPRLTIALRYRIEALAYHPDEEIRCLAYRIILLKSSNPEDINSVPAFIESGMSFLNENSIQKIAAGNFGKHRLDALKQRLYWYRTHLKWPAGNKSRRAFADVLGLLYKFARLHLEFYVPVRAELSRWILHRQDSYLSNLARDYFYDLANFFEETMQRTIPQNSEKEWIKKLVFEHGIPDYETKKLIHIFRATTFLEESIALTFNEWKFRLQEVPDNGIWVLRLLAFKEFKHYRLAINTISGKHFDLHLVTSQDADFSWRPETFYWMASLAGFPFGPAVAPMPGSTRPGFGVLTSQYIGGLTAWDKIREMSEIHKSSGYVKKNAWKKIFVKSFSVVLKAWEQSGRQIVPCSITPANIVVPEMDFRDSAVILSLAGWSLYRNTVSLVEPMVQDFYCRTASVYPWCRKQLSLAWIFDAIMEALGMDEALVFIRKLEKDLSKKDITCFENVSLKNLTSEFINQSSSYVYLPLGLFSAIDQYQEWYRMNPLTTHAAREQTILELLELFRLQNYPEYARYFFYRHTFFSDLDLNIQESFDRLLEKMSKMKTGMAIQLVELSELQATLTDSETKSIFTRMVFPRLEGTHGIDFVKVGTSDHDHVVVRFTFTDRSGHTYTLREPLEPKEIGQLYQLFYKEKYPKEISDHDHQYILTDEFDKIVGGLTYRYIEDHNILLDGIVVTSSLQGKGIASGMLEKFFASMAARGIEVVRAHFLFGNYYMKHFFQVDKKWGALIKKLNE